MRFKYRGHGESDELVQYHRTSTGSQAPPFVNLAKLEALDQYTWMKFPAVASWTPQKLELNGRKGRRVVCIFAEDGHHFRVYDLDSPVRLDEDEFGTPLSDMVTS